jgi:hypothetical protein
MSDNIENPLQKVFNMSEATSELDIEKDYAMVDGNEIQAAQGTFHPVEPPVDIKDEDDKLVEQRLDEVYDTAIKAFQDQTSYIEVIDPKYAARNAEVAANYLNIALQAANSRANVKRDRKRANQGFIPFPNAKKGPDLLVADRNSILKMLSLNVDGEDKKMD